MLAIARRRPWPHCNGVSSTFDFITTVARSQRVYTRNKDERKEIRILGKRTCEFQAKDYHHILPLTV